MAIIYDKVARKNPQTKEAVWGATVKTIKQVGEKEVAKLIADETTLNPKEAEMAIAQLQKVLLNLLKGGYSVKMGDWASFSVSLMCKTVKTPEEVKPSIIQKVNVNCRLSNSFKQEIAKAEFVPASKFQKEQSGGIVDP